MKSKAAAKAETQREKDACIGSGLIPENALIQTLVNPRTDEVVGRKLKGAFCPDVPRAKEIAV